MIFKFVLWRLHFLSLFEFLLFYDKIHQLVCVCGQENISLILSARSLYCLFGCRLLSLSFFLYFSRFWAFTDKFAGYSGTQFQGHSTHTLVCNKEGPKRVNKIEPWLSLSWRGERERWWVDGGAHSFRWCVCWVVVVSFEKNVARWLHVVERENAWKSRNKPRGNTNVGETVERREISSMPQVHQ